MFKSYSFNEFSKISKNSIEMYDLCSILKTLIFYLMLTDELSPVEIVRLSTAKYYHCFIHMALKQCMTVCLENLCFKGNLIHIINASINLKGILR